jgi:hypothetical protein
MNRKNERGRSRAGTAVEDGFAVSRNEDRSRTTNRDGRDCAGRAMRLPASLRLPVPRKPDAGKAALYLLKFPPPITGINRSLPSDSNLSLDDGFRLRDSAQHDRAAIPSLCRTHRPGPEDGAVLRAVDRGDPVRPDPPRSPVGPDRNTRPNGPAFVRQRARCGQPIPRPVAS